MNQAGNRNKKMTFQEYESKLSTKQPLHKGKNKVQRQMRSGNYEVQYRQKKFAVPTNNLRSQPLPSPQSPSFQTSPLIQPSNHSTYQSNNHKQNQQHALNTPRIEGSLNEYVSFKKQIQPQILIQNSQHQQEVSKLDLIFEKQPEDVQRKLRQLLLSYNAVMQYNQDEDKFQVDLLLPFSSATQKEKFVQKFLKTRQYINSEISNNLSQHQAHSQLADHDSSHKTQNQESSKNHSLSKMYQVHEINDIQNNSVQQGQNLLSVSLREQQVMRIHGEDRGQEKSNQVDFYALGQSLDLSIQRALTNIIKGSQIARGFNLGSQKIQNQHIQASLQHLHMDHQIQGDQHEAHDRHEQEVSQIYSQIPQGSKANEPHSIQRNIRDSSPSRFIQGQHNNPERTTPHNSNTDYNHSKAHPDLLKQRPQYERNSSYESPTVPYKHDKIHQKINLSNNQILIEEQGLQENQLEQYDEYQQSSSLRPYDNSYYSHDNSYEYSSVFDMIEQTAEQHQEEFSSPKEYQHSIRKQINATANMNSQSTKRNQTKHHKSTVQYSQKSPPNGPSSSLRKKYTQFLHRNHTKIQSFYLRIGKQMLRRQNTKKDLYSKQTPGSQQNSFKQQPSQILVLQDDETNIHQPQSLKSQKEIQQGMLDEYKRRIVLENQSMSSEDKVRYFRQLCSYCRYLARHAKKLYIDYVRNQNIVKRG